MFSYAKILSLKSRDFELWAWKAQRVRIENEMLLANTIRISQASNDKYRQFFSLRQSELYRLDGKLADIQKEAWEDLKAKARG